MAEPFDMEGRATLLPLRRKPGGKPELAVPGLLAGILNAASMPGRAMEGEALKDTDAIDFAMGITGGGLGSPKAAGLSLGMGGGGRRTASNVLDFGTESMTVKANRMAHTINERAGVYDKLKGQMDKTNRQRIEILQTLTQKLEGIKQYGIETDTLRNISPGELALKLRNTAGLTVAQARETSTRMLREYKTYLEDFQEAGKLSDTFQGLRTQVDDIGTELTDLKDQYNDMLVNVYNRITKK